MRQWWKAPLLVAVLTVVCVPSVAAQASRADSAAVLIEASRDLRERGEPEASEALLRFILDRFADTPSAAQARADLDSTQNARSSSVGRVELQVWSALYGLFVGVAAPAAASAVLWLPSA